MKTVAQNNGQNPVAMMVAIAPTMCSTKASCMPLRIPRKSTIGPPTTIATVKPQNAGMNA